MRWFQGSVTEAVAACKSRRAIFVVFVEGNDDASKKTSATVEDSTISSQLESDDFIAIKLDSGSESYRQFVQIYQLVPVPSIFFIGTNGLPLEVVAGEVAVADLSDRIKSVLEKSGKTNVSEASVPPKQEEIAIETKEIVPKSDLSPESAPSTSSADTDAGAPIETEKDVTSESQTNEPIPSTSCITPSASIEDKVQRAKELIEIKRQQKQEEEERKDRNRELERRRVGQEVQKLRKWQQEQEVKEMREQRLKEKLEEQAARQRVLEQINQDRAERAARMSGESRKEETTKIEELRVSAPQSDTARIQFRLPDGSSHTSSFAATTSLGEVRSYAASNLDLPFRDFAMSTTFPRREFTANDNPRTVRDLELVPTAVILILPASSSAVVSSPGVFDVVTRMIWTLIAPLAALLAYLRDFVYRRGNNSSGSNPRPVNTTSNPAPENNKPQPIRRRAAQGDSSIQRQGNIHRLTTRRDSSDDENNTWNGNSTQQM